MRSRRAVATLALVGLLGGSCGQRVTPADELLAALSATSEQSLRLDYRDHDSDQTLTVSVVVEDDLRREADIELDGRLVYREVIAEDRLVVRVLDTRAFDLLADRAAPVVGTGDTDVRGLLLSGVWVEDQVGAPRLLASERIEPGDDPVNDALHVFEDVRLAIRQSAGVVVFSEDDLQYRPEQDPFPHPAEGVTRYDLRQPDLPGVAAIGPSGIRVPPDLAHFRKLSVYVRDGIVEEVREVIDIEVRLDDLAEKYDIVAAESGGLGDVLTTINLLRLTAGLEPIVVRERHLTVTDVGADVRISQPNAGATASLLLLRNRGSETGLAPSRQPPQPEGNSENGES